VERDSFETRLVTTLEAHYLPICRHLTAASPGIGGAYQEAYGIQQFVTILNVFPRAQRPATEPPVKSDVPARLYWFSQTIGPGRGLEGLMPVLARLRCPTSLHRGTAAARGRDRLPRGDRGPAAGAGRSSAAPGGRLRPGSLPGTSPAAQS
jgi:hypothetical protein